MRTSDPIREFADVTVVFRAAGLLLFCLTALGIGAVAWVATYDQAGTSVVMAAFVPLLAGLLLMSIDMMSDMALSRRLTARKQARNQPLRPWRIPATMMAEGE